MSGIRSYVSVRATHGAAQSVFAEWSVNEWPEWETQDIFTLNVDADMLASLQSFRRDFERRTHKEIPAEEAAKLRRTLNVVEQRWQGKIGNATSQNSSTAHLSCSQMHKMQISSLLN
jgi:ribulose bisphosphate carboxylase small subunit